MKGVYLLHFSSPYKHAKHYIGYADYIDKRIQHHKHGTGARLCKVVSDAGIELIKARVWEGQDRTFERRLKNCKKPSDFCPLCNGDKANKRMRG
jgi:predicted GIY-YIG superfamily endonuclease